MVAGFFGYLWDTKDFITFSPNPTPNEKAVLIDGVKDGVFQNDWNPGVISPATNSVEIGYFTMTPSPNSGEVVAFSPGKAPFIKAAIPWSVFTDTVNVDFHDAYDITVTVWLLTDNAYNYQSQFARPNCAKARSIWEQEGHGLRITCNIQDARNQILTITDPSETSGQAKGPAKDLFNIRPFDCATHALNLQQNLSVYSTGVLNVYYVNSVDTDLGAGPHYGVHCNDHPDVIALGAYSVEGLLAHEIGHALIGNGLEDHIDDLSPPSPCGSMPTSCTTSLPNTAGNTPSLFDRTNVMHGASSWRATLTEGQVFQAFFSKRSVLNHNSIYNLGMGIRDTCGGVGVGSSSLPTPIKNECPQLDKRIWPDIGGEYGTWPAN